LTQTDREIRFVANVLEPSLISRRDALKRLNELDEEDLVETLRTNRVAVKFRKNLDQIGVTANEFDRFQVVRGFYEKLDKRMKEESDEYNIVAEEFLRKSIKPILIKSDGAFPYESDNLDALVRHENLGEATRQLTKIGYREVIQVREPHKFLFRKTGTSLAVHLHTRVEWEGTQFVDTDYLWKNAAAPTHCETFLIPSPEDFLLIVTAHFFFENHVIKLEDSDKVTSCIQKHDINWKQVLDSAEKQRWDIAFVLAILLVDAVHKKLYGRSTVESNLLSEFEESTIALKPFLKTLRPSSSYEPLLKIPYAVSAIFFIRKVLLDESLTLVEKARHLNYVTSNVLTIKAKQL
jgi:hypothetical protein